MLDPVEWSYDPADSDSRERVAYAALGLYGGFLAIILLAGLALVVQQILAGEYAIPALVLLLGLVGGPFSLLYVWPMLKNPEQRPPVFETTWRPDPGRMVVAIVIGSFVVTGLFLLIPYWRLGFLMFFLPALILFSQMNADGYIDPSADTIELYQRTTALSAVDSYRHRTVGPFGLFWITYATSNERGPRFLSVPRGVAPDVEATLQWGADQPTEVDETGGPGRVPLLVAAGCCLLAGVGLGLVGHVYANSVAAIAPGIGLFVVLGLLFAWLAVD